MMNSCEKLQKTTEKNEMESALPAEIKKLERIIAETQKHAR
jgi:hypothetical protein